MLAVQMVAVHNAALATAARLGEAQHPRAAQAGCQFAQQADAHVYRASGGSPKLAPEWRPTIHVYHHRGEPSPSPRPSPRGAQKTRNSLMDPTARLNAAPRCAAKSKRSQQACRAPAVKGRNVCHIHGGRSPGAPKGNVRARKHGHYSKEAIASQAADRRAAQSCPRDDKRSSRYRALSLDISSLTTWLHPMPKPQPLILSPLNEIVEAAPCARRAATASGGRHRAPADRRTKGKAQAPCCQASSASESTACRSHHRRRARNR